ncbi:MAG: MurR/RpiR family transcriptional regulator [Calditrichaeota bacterium]|nr:MAG: MurR/RpiR family transcriptional regulator [Calditrichota bacterium]
MEKKLATLKQRIHSRLGELTDSQKLVANYIVENPQRFALSSVRDLEKELQVSKSTIVRLAQALGYDGFHHMRSEFLRVIRHELDPIKRFRTLYSQPIPETDYFRLIFEESLANIQATARLVDREHFKAAVETLKKARQVYSVGLGISYYIAELAAYLLNRVSIRAHFMSYGGYSFPEQLVNLDHNDVLLAFSFMHYSVETIEAAKFAQERGLPVIAVTDKATSAIVPHSDVVLQVAVDSLTISNSMVPVIALIYAMIGQIGHDMKDQALQTLEKIEYVRREHSGKKNHKSLKNP